MEKSGTIKTFGKPKGQNSALPQSFVKKGTLEMTQKQIEQTHKHKWEKTLTKDKLVPKDDKPIMNLHSNKDFILTNKKEVPLWTKKQQQAENSTSANFGKVPK
mmetsp:Transcript_113182/g.243837  ORF Transcript_113182/g.243837 Transcript_113182/m.243837 type:complete len:103 (+) Transcript_113182:208-516(+)